MLPTSLAAGAVVLASASVALALLYFVGSILLHRPGIVQCPLCPRIAAADIWMLSLVVLGVLSSGPFVSVLGVSVFVDFAVARAASVPAEFGLCR